jgi:hypothetical protein
LKITTFSDTSGVNYNAMMEEECEAIKILKMFLNLTYGVEEAFRFSYII